ncbi:MAG: hypothetical protein ACMXYA_02595, partial [Candidatus Woesearchaeota archaeon]
EHIEDVLMDALEKYATHLHPGTKSLFSKDNFSDRKKRLDTLKQFFETEVYGQAGARAMQQKGGTGLHQIDELVEGLIRQKKTGYELIRLVDDLKSASTQGVLANYANKAGANYLAKFGAHERTGYLSSKLGGKYQIDTSNSEKFTLADPRTHFELYEHLIDPQKNPLEEEKLPNYGIKYKPQKD